jgi:DNA-binding CsgD family transcriptional regulator/tetratricopeptide (TPR) repeat protein
VESRAGEEDHVLAMGPGQAVSRPPSVELLEREFALESLERWWGEAADGEGRLVVVTGEAGIGKTALLRCFCERLGGGHTVLWGACDNLRTPRTLGPLADMAAAGPGPLRAALERAGKPAACFEALRQELASDAPTVLVFEDLHWADEATLDVLTMLGRRIEGLGALAIATYRDDAPAATDELRAVIAELQAGGGVRRLALPGLSAAAVGALSAPSGVDGAALHRLTAGNPFFVSEALAAGAQTLPDTVRDAVLARAGLLAAPARRVLDAVATAPDRIEVAVLDQLVGDDLEHLDECLESGVLLAEHASVRFRHELARLAVEEAIAPHRRVALHRAALDALRRPAQDPPDYDRLVHHAEEAGDGAAVLEFATAAAARAAAAGAHREAAAHYARALRFTGALEPGRRAELLERRSAECHMIADFDEAVGSLREALECHRSLGDLRRQGLVLRQLSRTLYCMGGGTEASTAALGEALEVLEQLPPGAELARAYLTMSSAYMNAEDAPGTFAWAARAAEIAQHLGDDELRIISLNELGTMEYLHGMDEGREKLELSLRLAIDGGFEEHAGRAYIHLPWAAVRNRQYDRAEAFIADGIEYCTAHDLDLHRHYVVAYAARMELDRGRFDEAAAAALEVAGDRRSSPDALATALSVLGLLRARRGDPRPWGPLDDAAELRPGADLQRLAPIAAARAEAHWLVERDDRVDAETAEVLALALEREVPWVVGELACWRRRAGLGDQLPRGAVAEPYRLSLAGDWRAAADRWRELGCPYEAAMALLDSSEPETVRAALEELLALGARATVATATRRLRREGVRGLPRGPRPKTRANPAGLTGREVEVALLLTEGLRNAQIAERLVVSQKTVDHHVSAVLRKLDARSRGEAAAVARRLGLSVGDQSS